MGVHRSLPHVLQQLAKLGGHGVAPDEPPRPFVTACGTIPAIGNIGHEV
jgi:hypothetical protein